MYIKGLEKTIGLYQGDGLWKHGYDGWMDLTAKAIVRDYL